jgi:hypothetical protein
MQESGAVGEKKQPAKIAPFTNACRLNYKKSFRRI